MNTINFTQSRNDFPLTVDLSKKSPAWGLSRWGGNYGLRFAPLDDEGFSIRGDKQRLVYKGRRRSHRFTILGDTAFEYDCILNREPESNVISLLMDGAENYDFLRQPDFVPDPFLKGSYAVYKKETLIGEGTGKLCHIHRPLIIDARGRRCWGEMSIVGNVLCITVPEKFLCEAVYPVIVDPTIGTSTVGSQTTYTDLDGEKYYDLFIEASVAVNRFLISESLSGTATAYVYAYEADYEGPTKPVLYSDNGNAPLIRRSTAEGVFDCEVKSGKPAGWRSASFNTNTNIESGTYIWFGLFCNWFAPKFDYGAKCYKDYWYDVGIDIPNTYPVWDVNWYFDLKLSMYFTYISSQNYLRTLMQGVTLTDTRKLTADYIRTMIQTVKCTDIYNAFLSFFRQCVMSAANIMSLSRTPVFIRSMFEQIKTTDWASHNRGLARKCEEITVISDETKRSQGFIRGLIDGLKITDNAFYPVLFFRSISETMKITDFLKQWAEYIRGLYAEAGNISEITRQSDYCRITSDTVQVDGSVFRGLLIFIKILTTSLVRDFLLRRFLIAREELVLKSCITRELTLDSQIN